MGENANIAQNIEKILTKLGSIEARVSSLETNASKGEDTEHSQYADTPPVDEAQLPEARSGNAVSGAHSRVNIRASRLLSDDSSQTGFSPDGAPSPVDSSTNAAGLQREYEILKDQLSKVKLPNELKVYDTSRGIKQNCQTALSVLSKSARYTETALKQLAVINSKGIQHMTEQDFDNLCTILHAEVNFLQSKFSQLVVKSNFDSDTNRFFDCLEASPTAFSPQTREHLRCAVELSAAVSRTQSQPTNRGGFRGRGRQRGGYGGYRGYQRQPDVFQNLSAGRGFPPRRGGFTPQPNNQAFHPPHSDD